MNAQKYILLLFALLFFAGGIAQEKETEFCGTDYLLNNNKRLNSDFSKKLEKFNEDWKSYNTKPKSNNRLTNQSATLSVVIHDIKAFESVPYLFDSTINTLADYQFIIDNLNGVFDSFTLNNETIEFCLASKNVNGDTYTLEDTQHLFQDVPQYSINIPDYTEGMIEYINANIDFPPNKFINIYLVDNIKDYSGFSTLPPLHGSLADGIVMQRSNVTGGTINNNILIHEMGHFLGLYHTFGVCQPPAFLDDIIEDCHCNNTIPTWHGDGIADTPPHIPQGTYIDGIIFNGYELQIIAFCDNENGTTNAANESISVNVTNNYMNYGPADPFLFTPNQIEKMQWVIGNDVNAGVRSSLLNNPACVSCSNFNDCQITIFPIDDDPLIDTALDHTLVENNTHTFSINSDCDTTNLTYTWNLTNLTTNTLEATITNLTFQIPNTLTTANYLVTCTINSTADPDCNLCIDYNFQVVPNADPCNFELDDNYHIETYSNNPTAELLTTPYNHPVQVSGNPIISTNNLPSTVTEVLHLGTPIDNNTTNALTPNDATYVSYSFFPTQNNAKYRVYFTGLRTSGNNFDNFYDSFNNTSGDYPTTFGWFCEYNYLSPITDTNTTINNYFATTDVPFTLNDLVINNFNDEYVNHKSIDQEFTTNIGGVNYNYGPDWQFIDLDFSEFIDYDGSDIDNDLNTEITITFFARTGKDLYSNNHSEAFFAVECLGGGIPKPLEFSVPDVMIPCEPGEETCFTPELPDIPYLNDADLLYNLYSFELAGQSPDDGSFNVEDYSNCFENISDPNNTHLYQAIINSLHETVSDTFEVLPGFYYDSIPPCPNLPTGDFIGGNIPDDVKPAYLFCCGDDEVIELSFKEPCFTEPYGGYLYRWKVNGVIIDGQDSDTLSFDANMFQGDACINNVVREVHYYDGYCSNSWEVSESYRIYNLNHYESNIKFAPFPIICYGTEVESSIEVSLDNSCYEIDGTTEEFEYLLELAEFNGSGEINYSAQLNLAEPGGLIDIDFISNSTISYTDDGYNESITSLEFIIPNNIPEGTHNLIIYASSNFNECSATNSSTNCNDTNVRIDNTSFYVNPTPLAGEILVPDYICNKFSVINNIDVLNYSGAIAGETAYGWEIISNTQSFSNNPPTNFHPNAGNSDGLSNNFFLNNFAPEDYPLKVRRWSIPFQSTPEECVKNNNHVFTEPVTIEWTEYPELEFEALPEVICYNFILPQPINTAITGNWNPANFDGPNSYTFTPTNQCIPAETFEINDVSTVEIFPVITITNNATGCPILFTGSNCGTNCGGETYEWVVINDTAVGNPIEYTSLNSSFDESDFDFTAIPGNYSVSLTITDSAGEVIETVTSIVQIEDECYYNCDGNWLKSIGTAGNSPYEKEFANNVVVDNENNIIVLGYSNPNTNIEGVLLSGKTYLNKYTADGCLIWSKDFSHLNIPHDMQINGNNELIVLTYSPHPGSTVAGNYYLSKLNTDGQELWSNELTSEFSSNNGSAMDMDINKNTNDIFLAVSSRSNSPITVIDQSSSPNNIHDTLPSQAGGIVGSIMQFNNTGVLIWDETLYQDENAYFNHVNLTNITVIEDTNEVFITGFGEQNREVNFLNSSHSMFLPFPVSTSTSHSTFILKVNTLSNNISHEYFPQYHPSGNRNAEYNETTNNYYSTFRDLNTTNSQSIIVVFDTNLNITNTYNYNGGYSKLKAYGGHVYASGVYPGPSYPIVVSKFNATDFYYNIVIGSNSQFNSSSDLAINNNKLYITGTFRDGNINLNSNTSLINHIGNTDGFVTRVQLDIPCSEYEPINLYSTTFDVLSGETEDYLTHDYITATNIIYSGGNSIYKATNSISLLPGFHAENGSNFNAYIEECIDPELRTNKIVTRETETEDIVEQNDTLKVYPNPVTDELKIAINNTKIYSYELFNIQGQLVMSKKSINTNKHTISVLDLSQGIYLLKTSLKSGEVITNKIIKN